MKRPDTLDFQAVLAVFQSSDRGRVLEEELRKKRKRIVVLELSSEGQNDYICFTRFGYIRFTTFDDIPVSPEFDGTEPEVGTQGIDIEEVAREVAESGTWDTPEDFGAFLNALTIEGNGLPHLSNH